MGQVLWVPAGTESFFWLTQGLRPGLFYVAPSGLDCGCFHGFGFECVWGYWFFGRFMLAWKTSGGSSVEIRASHPLHRTQRVGHPHYSCSSRKPGLASKERTRTWAPVEK